MLEFYAPISIKLIKHHLKWKTSLTCNPVSPPGESVARIPCVKRGRNGREKVYPTYRKKNAQEVL